jgi:hypothetical protein
MDPHPFTAVRAHAQPSAWTRDLEWGGGIALAALALAGGFLTAQPRSRRRSPRLPAPAAAQVRVRRR